MLRKYTNKLYCFSPPVMLATFLIEICMALYTVWRYKLDMLGKLVAIMLVCLGTFQFAEYMICGGLGFDTSSWSRLGYISITFLPALALHISTTLAGKKATPLLVAAYGSAVVWAAYFVAVPGAIDIKQCRPNYAIFDMSQLEVRLYTLQYYAWLLTGMYMAWRWAKQVPERAKALYAMIVGYLVFLVPTTTINLFDRSTVLGIPSIMCGFAILLAVILVGVVLPEAGLLKQAQASESLWRKRS